MRSTRIAAGAALLLFAVTGCGATVPDPAPRADPSATARAASPSPPDVSVRPSSSGSPSNPAPSGTARRPRQPIPNVRPSGFVSAPPGHGIERYERQRLVWSACHTGEQCASLRVPLDYARPDGQAITLAVARKVVPGRASLGTLFVNPGGPGVSGVDLVAEFPVKGLGGYTIIGWDPRGVARSTPVQCEGGEQLVRYTEMESSPDSIAEQRQLAAANRAFGRSCLQRSGRLLEHVSTAETVQDLDLLRQLTGGGKLNYFGYSYGTEIGARYAQAYPHRVGRMVLDGAVSLVDGPNGEGGTSQAVGFDRALNDFAGWAGTHGSTLGGSRPQVLRSITALWDRLDRHPLPVGGRELSQTLAVSAVTLLLYSNSSAYRSLDEALTMAEKGDGRALLYYADQYNERSRTGSYGQFNYAFPAIRCLDHPDGGIAGAMRQWRADEKDAPTFGPYFGPDFVCPEWPVAARPDRTGSPTAAGAAPIVVIGTTRDPATPYEDAVAMRRQLHSAVLVTLKGEGHTGYDQSACIRNAVLPYLQSGAVPRDGTTCTS